MFAKKFWWIVRTKSGYLQIGGFRIYLQVEKINVLRFFLPGRTVRVSSILAQYTDTIEVTNLKISLSVYDKIKMSMEWKIIQSTL